MELKPPPTNVWADDRAVLRRSPIDGTGLFAGDDIEAGTVVQRRGGRLVTSIDLAVLIAAADVDPTPPYVDTITVHEYETNEYGTMPASSRAYGKRSPTPATIRRMTPAVSG
jgi:hypothetical protein